jgi:Homoserine acetyltransferase
MLPAGGEAAGQASAWWDEIVGPDQPIDTTEQYVVCANVPGSCYAQLGQPQRTHGLASRTALAFHGDRWRLDRGSAAAA